MNHFNGKFVTEAGLKLDERIADWEPLKMRNLGHPLDDAVNMCETSLISVVVVVHAQGGDRGGPGGRANT